MSAQRAVTEDRGGAIGKAAERRWKGSAKPWFAQVTVQPSQRTKRFCVAATPQLFDVLVVRLSLKRPSLNPTAVGLWRRLRQLQHCHRSIYRPPTGNRIEVRVFRSRIDPCGVLCRRFRFRIWMSSRIPPRESQLNSWPSCLSSAPDTPKATRNACRRNLCLLSRPGCSGIKYFTSPNTASIVCAEAVMATSEARNSRRITPLSGWTTTSPNARLA